MPEPPARSPRSGSAGGRCWKFVGKDHQLKNQAIIHPASAMHANAAPAYRTILSVDWPAAFDPTRSCPGSRRDRHFRINLGSTNHTTTQNRVNIAFTFVARSTEAKKGAANAANRNETQPSVAPQPIRASLVALGRSHPSTMPTPNAINPPNIVKKRAKPNQPNGESSPVICIVNWAFCCASRCLCDDRCQREARPTQPRLERSASSHDSFYSVTAACTTPGASAASRCWRLPFDLAIWQCLLKLLHAFVRNLGALEPQDIELVQPLEVSQPSIRDSGAIEGQH